MSTKIDHGYRLTARPGEALNLFAFTRDLRDVLRPLWERAQLTALAEIATTYLDRTEHPTPAMPARQGEPASEESVDGKVSAKTTMPLSEALREVTAAAKSIRTTGQRNPDLDFQCEVTFLADPNHDPAHILYVLLFTERDDYTRAFEAMPQVSEYAYWNHSDRPEHLTDEQWEERRITWDRVLGRATPATHGLSWKLAGTYDGIMPTRDNLASHIPDIQWRAHKLALSRVKALDDDGQWRDLDDIRHDVAAVAAELREQLVPITVEDLYRDVPKLD